MNDDIRQKSYCKKTILKSIKEQKMRDYLANFFSTFAYNDDDAQFLLSAYDSISKREDTRSLWDEAIRIYEKDSNCNFANIISIAQSVAQLLHMHTYTAELLIFICLSKHLKELYIEREIDLEIFHNSMLDLKYKLDECKVIKGVVGTFVSAWFGRFFNLERVGLGRLQFEVDPFGRQFNSDGYHFTPESKVINVHIPRTSTHLTPESCDSAFAMAKEYFKDQIGGKCAFVCRSWMLYSENDDILPKDSNVRRFMSRFTILSSSKDPNLSDLWRLFDTDEKNIHLLPTDTRMRRAYVEHLKKGGSLGKGYGIYVYE